ncbi:hypothetical protein [Streptomyces sp. NPDC085540]
MNATLMRERAARHRGGFYDDDDGAHSCGRMCRSGLHHAGSALR